MSQDTSCQTTEPRTDPAPRWPEEFSDATVVKRYRFGARHALALSLVAILALAAMNAMLARNHLAEAPGWLETTQNLSTPEPQISPGTYDATFGAPRAEAQTQKSLWKKDDADLTSRVREFIDDAERLLERKAVDKAFADLDLNNRRQVRTFLAAYESNQYADEQGYPQAVKRRVLEERLHGQGEIVACDECWCWESKPAQAGPADLTD